MHYALSKLYQDPYVNLTWLNELEIRRVLEGVNDTRQFLLDVAHQKEDMIVGYVSIGISCAAAMQQYSSSWLQVPLAGDRRVLSQKFHCCSDTFWSLLYVQH